MTDWQPIATAPLDGTKVMTRETESPYREGVAYAYRASPECVLSWCPMFSGILLPYRPSEWKSL
jgi:hypothetical protein